MTDAIDYLIDTPATDDPLAAGFIFAGSVVVGCGAILAGERAVKRILGISAARSARGASGD